MRGNKDFGRLNVAVQLWIALSRYTATKQKAINALLTLVGHRFPKLRGAAAKAFYVRAIEGELSPKQLSEDEETEILSLLSETPWIGQRKDSIIPHHRLYEILGIEPPAKLTEHCTKIMKESSIGYAEERG